MIKSFGNKIARDLYHGIQSHHSRKLSLELQGKAQRLLDQIHAAPSLEFLRIPPSNHLEKLKGDLKDFWSLRINSQWRIIFKWIDQNVFDVEILDYHS